MGDESPRRRDVLRSGVAAGLVWLGWTTGHGLAQDGTTTQEATTTAQDDTTTVQDDTTTAQSRQDRYAFSYSLQRGDRFVIRFRPSDPVTETIPSNCIDGGSPREFQLFVVRAYRGGIDLGYRDLFVPPAATGTETPDATPTTEATTRGTASEGTAAEGTTTPEDESTPTEESALPEIRRGEWYRVASSVRCSRWNRLTLEAAQRPETTPGPQATTTDG